VQAEEVPPLLESEIEYAMKRMKNGKAQGEDQVVNIMNIMKEVNNGGTEQIRTDKLSEN